MQPSTQPVLALLGSSWPAAAISLAIPTPSYQISIPALMLYSYLSRPFIIDATFHLDSFHLVSFASTLSRTISLFPGDLSPPTNLALFPCLDAPDDYSAGPMARSRAGSALTFHLNKASCSWPVPFQHHSLTRKHSPACRLCPMSEGNTRPRGESCDNRPWLTCQTLSWAIRGSVEDVEDVGIGRGSR